MYLFIWGEGSGDPSPPARGPGPLHPPSQPRPAASAPGGTLTAAERAAAAHGQGALRAAWGNPGHRGRKVRAQVGPGVQGPGFAAAAAAALAIAALAAAGAPG